MAEINSLIGTKIGRLTVLEMAPYATLPNGKKVICYKCKCDCGSEKIVRKCHLSSGATVSCGCLHREMLGNQRRTHGKSHKERLYSLWLNMKDRCGNPNNNHYKSYGGRGITICEEWSKNYSAFRSWCLENGYVEEIRESGRNNLTIDRINNNGNYEPNNCRFVTNRENCLNKRDTMTDSERYANCPICGKPYVRLQRNGNKTCGVKCGAVLRKITISKGGLIGVPQHEATLCD